MKRICAKERNNSVRSKILRDFPKSIRDVMSHSVATGVKLEPGEEDATEDAYKKLADNLKVFCVSSSDYMKIQDLTDGSPAVRNRMLTFLLFTLLPTTFMCVTSCWQVFKRKRETEIPDLQLHIENVAREHKKVKVLAFMQENVDGNVDRFLQDVRRSLLEGHAGQVRL